MQDRGTLFTSSNPSFSVELNLLYMSEKIYTATEALKASSLSLIVDCSNSSASSGSCFVYRISALFLWTTKLHLQHLQWLLGLHSHQSITACTRTQIKTALSFYGPSIMIGLLSNLGYHSAKSGIDTEGEKGVLFVIATFLAEKKSTISSP